MHQSPYSIPRAVAIASQLGLKIWASHPGPANEAHAAVPGADTTYTDDGDQIDIWGDTEDGQRFNICVILTGPQYTHLRITRAVRETAVNMVRTGTTDRTTSERAVADFWGIDRPTIAYELGRLISSGDLSRLVEV